MFADDLAPIGASALEYTWWKISFFARGLSKYDQDLVV